MRDIPLKSTGLAGLLIAIGIAVFYINRYFPLDFLRGTSSYWDSETEDITQYIAGFNAYLQSPFTWPLLAFDSFNYPVGTRVTFVDALPLYALLLKIVLPAQEATFNPFGMWVGFSFVMQAVCAWWILRALRIDSWVALVSLVVLLLVFPALSARLGHISLMSHWIILGALALYIQCARQSRLNPIGWALWLVAGFYLNIYLFTMATAIYGAAFFKTRGYRSVRHIAWATLPFVVLAASLLVMLLPLPSEPIAREGGFGAYSMNLLAPFLENGFKRVPNAFMPDQQFEGYNYLGLGVIAAFLIALVVCRRQSAMLLGRHRSLFVLMALFTLYALSNHIYFGRVEVLTLSYPAFTEVLTSQLRASGRFFWPVGYSIVIFTLVILYRYTSRMVFTALMLAVLFIQVIDLRSVRHDFVMTANRPAERVLTPGAWDPLMGQGIAHIYFYPKFRCPNPDVLRTLMPIMRYTAERHLTLNTGYIARHQPACDMVSLQAEISQADLTRSAFIFSQAVYETVASITPLFPANVAVDCTRVDFAYLCKARRSEQ